MGEHMQTRNPEGRPADTVLKPLVAVTERVGLAPLSSRLASIRAWLSDDLAHLERAIRDGADAAELGEFEVEEHLAVQTARYLLGRPGKRIRPLCVMLGARMGGREMDREVKDLAVACELIHAATLLHDDVIDEGTERRGVPAARVVYGNSASVLAGDHLLLYALKLVESVGYRRLLSNVLDTIADMVTAEAIQLEQRGRFEPNRSTYLQVIQGKTAGLFRFALAAGGTLGGLPSDQVAELGQVGNALGLAFQLMDDVLDVEGNTSSLGKDLLVDLREGKLTWPFILACERDPKFITLLQQYVQDSKTNEDLSASEIILRLKTTGAIVDTRKFAEAQGAEARQLLAGLPVGATRTAIEAVIDSAIRRKK